jgi:hypothetical protein
VSFSETQPPSQLSLSSCNRYPRIPLRFLSLFRRSPITDHRSPITNRQSPIANRPDQALPQLSAVSRGWAYRPNGEVAREGAEELLAQLRGKSLSFWK